MPLSVILKTVAPTRVALGLGSMQPSASRWPTAAKKVLVPGTIPTSAATAAGNTSTSVRPVACCSFIACSKRRAISSENTRSTISSYPVALLRTPLWRNYSALCFSGIHLLSTMKREEFRTVYDSGFESTFALVEGLSHNIDALSARVQQLEDRLAKNSRNSGKPPSSDDPVEPKPKSLRRTSAKKPGAQEGHPGRTLSLGNYSGL